MIKVHCKFDEMINPSSLKPHPKNRNRHSQEQIERLAKILEYQGWRYAIKVSKQSGFITTGHGRVLSAILKKWDKVPVVYQDYESEEQEYADVQADNAIASWAELDLSGINIDLPDLGPDFDIELLGIEDFEIEPADKYADKDADETPDVRKTDIKLGDLFQLGNHRLLCGDSTSKEAVERLMNGERADMVYTDPPYGMNLDTDYRSMGSKNNFKRIIGDDSYFDPTGILAIFKDVDEIFLFGADYYCWSLPQGGSWIVWDKRSHGEENIGTLDGSFGSDFELCWSKSKHQRAICRVIRNNGAFIKRREGVETMHPSQKPIEMHVWFFDRWGKDKTNIVDLYLGSGSTLIACEKTNRKCFGSEIDPTYCDVIIRRWEKFSGQTAYLIEDTNGKLLNGTVSYAELNSLRLGIHTDESKNIAQKNVGTSGELIVRKNAKAVAKKA